MRLLSDRRTSVLATVTGISVGIAGVLLFVRFGPTPGPQAPPDPAAKAYARPLPSHPRIPTFPSLPGRPPGPTATGDRPGPSSDVPHANAPTDNLRRLATALRLKHKSITGVLTVPPGLNLTARVEISMLWDEGGPRPTRATQDYNNATGNRFIFPYPAGDSSIRKVANIATLAEFAANGEATPYAVRANVSIEPLYDLTVSALQFKMLSDCDTVGASEVNVGVRYADDQTQIYEINTYAGNTHVFTEFARAYQEIGQSSKFVKPIVGFIEQDPRANGFDSAFPPLGTPLLLGADYTFDRLVTAINDKYCQAAIKYSVSFRLREYLYLD
jgi:hypothetical protein